MQTKLTEELKQTTDGAAAAAILRKCVHCGFCLATCPTYQVLGDELDSPRGRIYLIKQMLEGEKTSGKTQLHLDRCLTCRACETTCPSGVEYGQLLQIGREHVERTVRRGPGSAALRFLLPRVLEHRRRFALLLGIARGIRPALPRSIRRRVPPKRAAAAPWPAARHARKMVLLDGCVQPALDPAINSAAARVLDRLGISLVAPLSAGCCGAISHHLARGGAPDRARRNIDAWWPWVESGAEAVVVTASGCGPMLRDYGHLLRADPRYAAKAARISSLALDISQVVASHRDELSRVFANRRAAVPRARVAFHTPCTLQHALKLSGVVEPLLAAAGYELVPVAEGHLCCGSAGTYSITQPELSGRLLARKVRALEQNAPQVIATANIGCLTHIGSAARTPVVHWIQLLAEALADE